MTREPAVSTATEQLKSQSTTKPPPSLRPTALRRRQGPPSVASLNTEPRSSKSKRIRLLGSESPNAGVPSFGACWTVIPTKLEKSRHYLPEVERAWN
jgi:hypothetical protein